MSNAGFHIIVACALCALICLLPFMNQAAGQETARMYKIQIVDDLSAVWTITQVQDINAPIDTWEGFQMKCIKLVEDASSIAQRQMVVEPNSMQMETVIHHEIQSKTTEYKFTWQNFTIIDNKNAILGDVFRLSDFFGHLYGEGALELVYEPPFTITSVTPTPTQRDDNLRTLDWFRTQDFVNGRPNIVLTVLDTETNPDPNIIGLNSNQIFFLALGSGVIVGGSLVWLYVIRKRKRQTKEPVDSPFVEPPKIETDEEKILGIVRKNGGTLPQSAITDQCRFSKAKTSQLLTALEKKEMVTRYKKGRDKIVTLAKNRKGEQT
jgi:uncharacterized membrane protein